MLIRLRGCAVWSALLLFAYGMNRFSHDVAYLSLFAIIIMSHIDQKVLWKSIMLSLTTMSMGHVSFTHMKIHWLPQDFLGKNPRSHDAFTQSDQSLLSAWRKLGSLATHWVHSKDSDQTGWMPRLIWVFAGHTCHFVGFVTMRLICVCCLWWILKHLSGWCSLTEHSQMC